MNTIAPAPQPIPYQGSKRRIAAQILRHFPPRFGRLVEPFAGSAALSIAAAAQGKAQRFWINDANGPLIELWRAILERPQELAGQYAQLWYEQAGRERAFFDEVRERFNAQHGAADLLYLLARCVKAAVRYNGEGRFNNSPDNRRRGAHPSRMRQRIAEAADLLRGRARLTAWDYQQVLARCTSADVVYLDPPYQGVSDGRDSRYLQAIDHAEFRRQLKALVDRGIALAVSYDGRTGEQSHGRALPKSLDLVRLEISAGRSSQATLLGRAEATVESLYLSPNLAASVER